MILLWGPCVGIAKFAILQSHRVNHLQGNVEAQKKLVAKERNEQTALNADHKKNNMFGEMNKKHKRKIDKLNNLQDEKNERGDFATHQRWYITEPRGLEVKGYQDLKALCKYLVDEGKMEYDQSD